MIVHTGTHTLISARVSDDSGENIEFAVRRNVRGKNSYALEKIYMK